MSSGIRVKKRKLSEQPSSIMTSLPDDIILDILARVPRCDYPMLSLVSKHFQSLVVSRELYARRSLLGCTEACIYASLYDVETLENRLYILRRKDNRLVLIPSLGVLPCFASFVPVGSKIYVLGKSTSSVAALRIDCRFHKVQSLPSMPTPVDNTVVDYVAGYVNMEIYVIGYCRGDAKKKKYMINVFNTETKMWESESRELDKELGYMGSGFVVMEDKIYIRDYSVRDKSNSLVYWPEENKWETDEMLNSKDWRHACVIDDLLCCYDLFKKELRAYDTKHKLWRVVKGVAEVFPEATCFMKAYTVSFGGKLAVFLRASDISSGTNKIWCAEIAIERRGREIWGKVEWCDAVMV